jgi:cysteine synthase A
MEPSLLSNQPEPVLLGWGFFLKLTLENCEPLHHATSGVGIPLMNALPPDILHCIGNTSLLALRHIVPANGARILLKLESENPTGSMKDRMALAMIGAAEADGRLPAGGSVVEYTGGSTGVSLSLVRAVKRYPLHIVSSDAFSREKLDHMKILGARLQIVPSEGGGMTEKLTRDMVEAARIIAAETGAFWTDQLNNTDQLAAYHKLAEEIWRQTRGEIDAFVQSVGTAASLRGTGEALRRHNERIRIVAVEPSESPVLSGGQPGSHKIDGIGAGFVVPLWQQNIADHIEQVSTAEAVAMALRLAREEGLFAGTSTGANVIAALRLAELEAFPRRLSRGSKSRAKRGSLGPRATIVTVMCDTGMKYLKTFGAELSRAGVAPGGTS